MTIAPQHHIVRYRILNHDLQDPDREIEVHATPEEIGQLVTDGFLVREGLFAGQSLDDLRTALAAVEAKERETLPVAKSRRFGGLYLRYLMDKHEVFLRMLKFQPTLSIARALMGPQVQVRGLSARITYPDQPEQETHWHFHHRVIPKPLPPFFTQPHGLDCLIYLDDIDEATGPLCLMPGSHRRLFDELPAEDYSDKPGQIVLSAKAGTCVIIHSNLWHRALRTGAGGSKRRVLILAYTPTWMRHSPYGEKPDHGLTEALLKDADAETKELLGAAGYT